MSDKQDVILVDFAPAPGVRGVAKISMEQLQQKSAQAIDKAMGIMRAMADKGMEAVQKIELARRPSTMALEFGLKLTAEGGALLAKAGVEAHVTVTLTWNY